MNPHQHYLVEQFTQTSKHKGATIQRPEHLGTSRTLYGLRNDDRRNIIYQWIAGNRTISFEDWLALIDALYRGQSYEERCTPPTLFAKFPAFRKKVPLDQLDTWLGQLDGWAEVDSTCQSIFTAQEMLANWDAWRELLTRLTYDHKIEKRRSSLVLLTTPITKSADQRILDQALWTIDTLKHESDKLITKAISWLLRKGITRHRNVIEHYLDQHADTLPAIAIRETRRKLDTGKK